MSDERPRFRVNELSFVGHALCQPMQEVFYTPPANGDVSANLSPLNDEAQALVDAQKRDHPDKTIHRGTKRAAEAKAEAELLAEENDTTNGPLPKKVKPKGDTRTAKAEKPGKKAPPAPEGDAPKDDDDIG